jgi:dihydroorotate dehydrogenase
VKAWFPNHPPIYDISKTYLENAEEGPFFNGSIPPRPQTKAQIDFLGHKLLSPLGVPAGPLLNAKWIALAGKLGFDVLTYKTIRSFAYPGHGLPNMIFVKPAGAHLAYALDAPPTTMNALSVTNSFGMPSRSPDYLIEDIEKAKRSLSKGQLLIVSIVGTPNRGVSFLDDFIRAASFAKEAGAEVIEANFSCPNVDRAEGILYTDPETVQEYASAIAKEIHPIPLLLKFGEFSDPNRLKEVLIGAARGKASGVCGINTISMKVLDSEGHPALGPGREQVGVCGAAIRDRALHFIRSAAQIIRSEKLGLALLGCGGITAPEHFDEFLHSGAQIAMTATGMMWDPFLAMRYHLAH